MTLRDCSAQSTIELAVRCQPHGKGDLRCAAVVTWMLREQCSRLTRGVLSGTSSMQRPASQTRSSTRLSRGRSPRDVRAIQRHRLLHEGRDRPKHIYNKQITIVRIKWRSCTAMSAPRNCLRRNARPGRVRQPSAPLADFAFALSMFRHGQARRWLRDRVAVSLRGWWHPSGEAGWHPRRRPAPAYRLSMAVMSIGRCCWRSDAVMRRRSYQLPHKHAPYKEMRGATSRVVYGLTRTG
jgi:hypothetical protein